MFDPEFYPTSKEAWEAMNVDCYGKRVLDPSAGSGHILKYALESGADTVEGIEKNDELRRLLGTKYQVIGKDWFETKQEDIAHVQMILMNPPYSNADRHILHAWKVAPEGCEIVAQCNANTVSNVYSRSRSELERLIADYGSVDVYQDLYKRAERVTGVEVAVVRLFKPISSSNPEFEGFYHDMPELNETSGVVRYNDIQALVNNYTGAVRCFDRFAEVGIELNAICKQLNFGSEGFNFKVSSDSHDGMIVDKMVFAKALQKKCWSIVFSKFDLEKYLTKGVMSDVNKFVESRQNYPFTMKNIFRMVEIIVGTKDNSMQRAVVEAVDNFTRHTHENRFGVEGWKTNTGHMLNKKFITPNICENQYSWEKNGCVKIDLWKHNFETIMDLTKALCFLTGKDYNRIESIKTASLSPEQKQELAKYREDDIVNGVKFNPLSVPDKLYSSWNQFVPNTWYEWGFFRFKVYKKGTGHFEFLDENDWARLNQAYAKAKGQVLPEKIFNKKK